MPQAKLRLPQAKPKKPLKKLPTSKKLPVRPYLLPTKMPKISTVSKKKTPSTTLMKMARLPKKKQLQPMLKPTTLKVWAWKKLLHNMTKVLLIWPLRLNEPKRLPNKPHLQQSKMLKNSTVSKKAMKSLWLMLMALNLLEKLPKKMLKLTALADRVWKKLSKTTIKNWKTWLKLSTKTLLISLQKQTKPNWRKCPAG